MAGKRWKLSALWCKKETTFGTDPSASGAAYLHIKALPDLTFEPKQDVVERPGLVNDLVRQSHAMGAKGGMLNLKLELKGSGTGAVSGVAAIAAEADEILQALFGTVTRGTGSLYVAAGSTTTVINVTPGTGINFARYMMVIIDCGATYGYVARFITSIATDALTLDRALPVGPTNGAVIQASSMYTRANSGHSSLAFVAKRAEATSIEYNFLGCKIDSAKVTGIQGRGTALLEVSISVSDWNASTKASLPSTVLTGVTAVKAPVIKGSCFALGGTEELAYGLDFDFNHTFEFQDATCALGTAQPDSANAGVELTNAGPKGTVKSYFSTQHGTDFYAGNEISLAFTAVNQGNRHASWGIYCPKVQHVDKTFEEHAGLVGESLPFAVNDNSTLAEYSLCVA